MGKKSPLFSLSPFVISPAERKSFPSEEAINTSQLLCWLQNKSVNPSTTNHHQVLPAQRSISPEWEAPFFGNIAELFSEARTWQLSSFPTGAPTSPQSTAFQESLPISPPLKASRARQWGRHGYSWLVKKGAMQMGNGKHYWCARGSRGSCSVTRSSHHPTNSQYLPREAEITVPAISREMLLFYCDSQLPALPYYKKTWPWLSQSSESDNIFRHDILLQQRVQLQEPSNGFCKALALQLGRNQTKPHPNTKKLHF